MSLKYLLWCMLTGVAMLGSGNHIIQPPTPGSDVSYTIKAAHMFSSLTTKDHFQLSVSGKSIAEGRIMFTISTSDHKEIFRDSFPAYDLLYNYDAAEFGGSTQLSRQKKENIIQSRMKRFFSDTCFRYPAINPDEQYDKGDNIDQSAWNDIHSDKTSIGFVYAHGYESMYGIAFSKKKKKTVLYYYSD